MMVAKKPSGQSVSYEAKLQRFQELVRRIEYYQYTLKSLIYWDKITYMPPEGIDYRSKVMAFLADEQYKLLSGREFCSYVRYFDQHNKNNDITSAMLHRIQRSSAYVNKIPEEEYQAYIELIAVSEQVWDRARLTADFGLFQPYLEKIVETFRRFAACWGYEKSPYDALLGYYEEELTCAGLDQSVEDLKDFLIFAVQKIQTCGIRAVPPLPPVSAGSQRQVWKMLLQGIGFDLNAGRIDLGSHTTILANSPSDVRIVNSYNERDFIAGLFNTLHSGGKGIYQQSIDKDLLGTFLAEAPSFTMEESIGRLYENIIGRSRGFCRQFWPKILGLVPELKFFSGEDIFRRVNMIHPSPLRAEADELTYLLHIIIRYELERDLIEGALEVEDLPRRWNEKYQAYLGVCPKNNGEGVLQDIHWAAGYMGYFPTYFVANLMSAQIVSALERTHGPLDELVDRGNFAAISRWLSEHIFRCGARYSTRELLERATGESLEPNYYKDYLRKKFSGVYGVSL